MVQLTLPLSSLPTAHLRAGQLRVKEAVQEALKSAIDRSGLDREYIAAELSRLTGEKYSIHSLNNWTAESKGERQIPLVVIGAMLLILGDGALIEAALGVSGWMALGPDEQPVYEIGRMAVEKKHRQKREKELWEKING